MRRLKENLFARARFHNFAGIHHVHPVRHVGDDAKVVRDEDDGKMALFFDFVDQLEDFRLHGNVQCGSRLVADQDLRIARERNCDYDALAHTAGELERVLVKAPLRFRDADSVHQLKRAVFCFFRADFFAQVQYFGDLLSDLHDRVERGKRILENQTDAVAADLMEIILGNLGEIHAVIFDLSFFNNRIRREDAHDRLNADRFAGAGFAHDRHSLAALEVKAYAAHGAHHAAICFE